MIQPRPWHDKADEMLAAGATLPDVAKACEVAVVTVRRYRDPAYRAAQMQVTAERHNHRMQHDPVYRAEWMEQANRRQARSRMRQSAKCEAYDTGKTYEDVCAAWGIAP